jgi:hypothetical protein
VDSTESVTVRMFGSLRTLRLERGLPAVVESAVAPGGTSARDLAIDLGLPLDGIEAVFCNHTAYGLDHIIMPGDRVAFVPFGTPGPWRMLLGIREAGQDEEGNERTVE